MFGAYTRKETKNSLLPQKPKEREIKRFENGANKNTLTPRHEDLGGGAVCVRERQRER